MNIKTFKGLNNVSDPMRLGLGWLTTANNVNITSTGGIEQRKGYSRALTGSFTAAYGTIDTQRLYLVDGGVLKAMAATPVALQTLASTAPMFWCEVNEDVYFNNGVDSGIIRPDHSILAWRWERPATPTFTVHYSKGALGGEYQAVSTSFLADGRETGTGDFAAITVENNYVARAAGSNVYTTGIDGTVFSGHDGELRTALLDPLPLDTDVIQHWKGRIYAAQYMPAENQTVIWFSQPLGYHLFSLDTDFIMVPGRVLMLAPHDGALLIGTGGCVYAYDIDKLTELAPYGVVPGQHWSEDGGQVFFWTARGLCSALPFVNHTEKQVSVAPGVHAGGAVLKTGGQRRYVVALQQGGAAFNQR